MVNHDDEFKKYCNKIMKIDANSIKNMNKRSKLDDLKWKCQIFDKESKIESKELTKITTYKISINIINTIISVFMLSLTYIFSEPLSYFILNLFGIHTEIPLQYSPQIILVEFIIYMIIIFILMTILYKLSKKKEYLDTIIDMKIMTMESNKK